MSTSRETNQSIKTVEQIIDAAYYVLVNYGHAAFTMRLVAKSAGISLGNLTYHFATKNELLKALVKKLAEAYVQQYEQLFETHAETIEQQIEKMVHWAMKEVAVDEGTVRVAREVWAMALHDDEICQVVDDFYDELIDRFSIVLNQLNSDLDRTTIDELVCFLILLSEGSLVLFGTRQKRTLSIEHMVNAASLTLCNMLR